ncbi:MAG: response regulator, partial [Candidatus Eremiobacteraeota bacterium]|nr:response regulator [Candidatus Eremiobacteraeota bacterium]
ESTLGKGTTFSVFVPFDKGDPCGASSCQPAQQLNGLRCLVVEGDLWSRESLREQLERWHAHCTVASSGEEALAILHADDTFRAAFVASSLNDMTALELIERVRSAEIAPATSIAVMGSLREHRDDGAIARLRIDDWLYAPIRSSDVYNVLVGMIETPIAACETACDAADAPACAPAADEPTPAAHERARILLAEDNLVNQEVMYETAGYLGYRITVVSNGAEAVEAVRHGKFDLVLMDCHMPVLDGYAATAAIRDLERMEPARRRTPIVALSANAMDDDKRRCLEAGMDDHLAKPFALQELRATIEQWADTVHRRPDAREPAIDVRALERIAALRRPGRPDPVARIVTSFLNDMPAQLDALAEAARAAEFGALRDGAHSLKSSSANVGATKLAALFRDLERQGTERDGMAAPATLRAIDAEYQLVRGLLSNYLAGAPGAV